MNPRQQTIKQLSASGYELKQITKTDSTSGCSEDES